MDKTTPIKEPLEVTLAEIGKRNLLRAKEVREKMGEKWACHPSHAPVKKKY
jgi:hypothetical protein